MNTREIIVEKEYTPKQVAKICRVNIKTVRIWIKDKTLLSIKRGGRYYIRKTDLVKFIGGDK